MGSCLCDQCAGLCCRYFVLEIDTPETRRQYDDVRWYLIHENTFIFIEKGKWHLGIYAKCKHLQPDNRCGIYETRPAICRKYSTDNCDYHGGEYDWEVLFTNADQLMKYADEKLAECKRGRRKVRAKKKRGAVVLHADPLGMKNGNGNGNGRPNGNGKLSLPLLGR